jgi:hypothetical protein
MAAQGRAYLQLAHTNDIRLDFNALWHGSIKEELADLLR